MAKKSWDSFVKAHTKCASVSTAIGFKVGQGSLDPERRKLPSGYGMLTKALKQVLKNDWTIRKVGKVAQILISDAGIRNERF